MESAVYTSFAQWYRDGHLAPYVRTLRSPGGILDLLEASQPAGDMSDPAVPDFVLYQCVLGGNRVSGNLGWGRFSVTSEAGDFFPAAPEFANEVMVETNHVLRSLSFPIAQWQHSLDEATDGKFSFARLGLGGGTFSSPVLRSAIRGLWTLTDLEGAPSRLLARAAGCEVLAELYRMGGGSLQQAKGGLAPWAEKRAIEVMRARLSEDLSLDELASEVQLSTFHFARMFKQSTGVPPRAYLTRLRIEKVCELLEHSDLQITEIASRVGYSSNQVLARVFFKSLNITPTDYRRAIGKEHHGERLT